MKSPGPRTAVRISLTANRKKKVLMKKTLSQALSGAALCAVLAAVASPAHALFGDDEARKAILDLRDKVQTAQQAQVQLMTQIEQLQQQNAELTGRVEQLTQQLSVQQRSVRDLFANLDKRVGAMESHIEKVDGAEISVTPEEKRRYDTALALFSDGKYEQSGKLLESLLTEFPQGGYTPFALYWLGNAYFAQGEHEDAVATQDRLINEFASSTRVPDGMLSKAAAQASLGKRTEAARTLDALIKKYPDSEQAKIAKERRKALGEVSVPRRNKKSAVK